MGVLHVVATPIGNLEDMTYRAVRVLGEVDIIAAEDTRAVRRLLEHFAIRGDRQAAIRSFFTGNEARRTAELVSALADGKSVALVSEAGTPAISDPGERLVRAALDAGHRVEVLPGPSAAITALVASGLSAARFLFVGFPPRKAGARQRVFGELSRESATLILYESPERVAATLGDLVATLGPERQAALCRELTKRFEETVRGTLAELAARYGETGPRGECTLVIAGADPAASRPGDDDIEGRVRELLTSGLGPRDIATRLVLETGKPRRQLYQLALSLDKADP